MPFGALRHQTYFPGSTSAPPEGATEANYHHLWQSVAINLNSGFAALWIPFLWIWAILKWAWRIGRMKSEKRQVMERAYLAITHPAFRYARHAVKDTAHSPHFKRKTAWADLSHKMKERTDWAENSWRHLNADYLTVNAIKEDDSLQPMDRPTLNLMVELAYHHYTVNPRMSTNGYV